MSASEPILYRFPLCCLAYGDSPKSRLHSVVDYCCAEEGIKRFQSWTSEEVKESVTGRSKSHLPTDFIKTRNDHVSVVLGQIALGVTGGHVPSIIKSCLEVRQFVNSYVTKYGPQPWVVIRNDLVWEVIKGKGISWRELSILAAIYSWIGASRNCAWITRSVIIQRALGYKDKATMTAELAKRTDGEKPMTVRQVNYYVDRLHERRFFARVRPNPFRTYYSTKLNQDELEKKFLDRATYSEDFHARRLARAADFKAKLSKTEKPANVNAANVNVTPEGTSTLAKPENVHGTSTETSTTTFTNTFTVQNPDIKPSLQNPSHKTCTLNRERLENEEKPAEKKPEAPKPDPKPILLPPTLEAVSAFFEMLRPGTGCRAADWFDKYGSLPRWATEDWKTPASKWLLDGRRRKTVRL